MINLSLDAVIMLRSMLDEQQERIEDAQPECDPQLQADLDVLAELRAALDI